MKLLLIAKLIWAMLLAKLGGAQENKKCLVLPGDADWPNAEAWSLLNSTVNGKLVATVPIGSPCHDPTYDASACDALKAAWTNPLTQ
jgi:hypothetical protein